ncbi:MAG: arylsulfatase A-like enzyme [Mariniblastus sp.]|jgi:arylsulfatase A-like enzyme
MTNSFQNLTAAKVQLTILLTTCSLILASVASAERPNVVILFTDDHGTLDANCYGSTDLMTPSIDRLAASGVRFTQAYAHKVCCPARAALLTGRHPQRSNVTNWTQGDRHGSDGKNTNMKAEEVTIAEALKSNGYETALFGKWHLGAKIGHGPLDQGFDHFFGHLGGFIDNYRHYFLHGKGFHDLYDGDKEVFHRGEYFPDMMIERAVDFIGEKRDAPFFMMVAFNLPHYPEQPLGKYADAYSDLPMPRQSYARVVSTVDDYIGRIMSKLQETGQRENTIVILMGDNGHSAENNKGIAVENHTSGYPKGHYYLAHGGGGNTGKWIGQKASFLEGGIRVPAIISYPMGLPKGEVRDQIVTVMDWFPTILDLVDIAPSKVPFDGKSMMPLIHDDSASTAHDVLHFGWANEWAVREGDWKLIGRINKANPGRVRKSLHNLTGVEPEVKDHASENPNIVARLTDLHDQWAKEVALQD